jgi:glycosyltransferase involved in cell wall biosynthesis
MPDARSVWIPEALLAGRRMLSAGSFAGILSFAQPWSDHIISRQLSKEFNLPWIAHFSDPWSDSPYYRLNRFFAAIRRKMERMVIRDANAVMFVSEETRSLVMKKYPPEWAARAHVIPHCFEPIPLQKSIKTISRMPLRLVYTGGFYGLRTPVNLFKSIGEINREENLQGRLEVILAGSGTELYAGQIPYFGLEGIVKISPVVPYHESLKIAGQADVLLVIDAPSRDVNVFLPSKLVEYMAFQKPIFGITPTNGATANLLRRLECPLVDTEDLNGIRTVLKDLIRRKEEGRLTVSPSFESASEEYSVSSTTRQYAGLLDLVFNQPENSL